MTFSVIFLKAMSKEKGNVIISCDEVGVTYEFLCFQIFIFRWNTYLFCDRLEFLCGPQLSVLVHLLRTITESESTELSYSSATNS